MGSPASIPDHAPEPLLGWVHPDALTGLGLDPDLVKRALTTTNQDALLQVVGTAVPWQGEVLFDLASGSSLAEVTESLSLSLTEAQPAQDSATTEDDRLLEGFRHPAAQMAYTWIENNDELRRVIEDGDFGAWRVFLHPEQRKYATRATNGAFRLSGGAGTGKTVVVLHRARHLARRHQSARIILTTFTTNLADQLHDDLRRLDPGLPVAERPGESGVYTGGIDALAYAVLKLAGTNIEQDTQAILGVSTRQVTGRTRPGAWKTAIDQAGTNLPPQLRSESFFAAEYAHVVLPHKITGRDLYFKVRRPGRGVALNRTARSAVWDVVEAYRAQSRIDGTVDFAEAAALAATHLHGTPQTERTFLADHVLVDEAQDLSPVHWQLLRALVPEQADDLFIAEDSHQRIYGQHVTLSHYGISIRGRSRRLRLNYRTTAQNLAWAVHVLDGADFTGLGDDDSDSAQGYRSARSGPEPEVRAFHSLGEELDHARQVIEDWQQQTDAPETIAVLVRDRIQRDRVVKGLGERGLTVRAVDREPIKPGQPVVMTMHRAKGTEFSHVLLFGINDRSIPAALVSEKYDETAWADAMLRERSLLYVAASRARDQLAASWSGQASEFLPVSSAP